MMRNGIKKKERMIKTKTIEVPIFFFHDDFVVLYLVRLPSSTKYARTWYYQYYHHMCIAF